MGIRQDKLGDQIRDILARCFLADQMNDPRLKGITITAVKLSADLQIASVYYRTYENTPNGQILKGFESAQSFFRKRLSEGLDVRRIPQLRFFYDESVEKGARIEELLETIKSSD